MRTRDEDYKYAEWITDHFAVGNKSGPEWMIPCPIHGDDHPSLQFNVESGLWICFGCSEGGRIEKLANFIGFPVEETEIDVADVQRRINNLIHPHTDDVPTFKAERMLERYKFPTTYWTDPKPHGRGYSAELVELFQLGYDPIGDDDGEYVTIPVRDMNGRLLGLIRRYLDDDIDKNMRYRYSKGYKKSHHLFAAWLLDQHPSDTIVLCEGSTDAMAWWDIGVPALGQLGSSISLEQIRILRRLGIRKIIKAFDNDKAGRKSSDYANGWRVVRRKVKSKRSGKMITKDVKEYREEFDLRREFIVEEIRYREGWGKDPDSLSVKQRRKALASTRRLN